LGIGEEVDFAEDGDGAGVGEAVAVVGLESCAAAKLHLAPCLAEDAAKGEPEFLTLGSERGGDK